MPKIDFKRLQTIIREELQNLNEADNEADARIAASKQSLEAAKLRKTISEFRVNATSKALAELDPHLAEVEKILDRVSGNSAAYVDSMPRPEKGLVKKVKFAPQVEK
jgi:uncharacterized protein YPO0396